MKKIKSILYNLSIAIAITLFFKLLFFNIEDFFEVDLLFIVAIIILIWFGNNIIDKWLNTKYPWIENTKKRLIIQSIFSIIFAKCGPAFTPSAFISSPLAEGRIPLYLWKNSITRPLPISECEIAINRSVASCDNGSSR